MKSRISDRDDWFEVWLEDKCSMHETMLENLKADLDAGWAYNGQCIQRQLMRIREFVDEYEYQMCEFLDMDEKSVNRWCFYDMKRRGVIC